MRTKFCIMNAFSCHSWLDASSAPLSDNQWFVGQLNNAHICNTDLWIYPNSFMIGMFIISELKFIFMFLGVIYSKMWGWYNSPDKNLNKIKDL